MIVSGNLRNWYKKNKRILPWRESGNPYYIWISEIILQQTRVNQGMDYYYRFIERFPTIFILAYSLIEEVLLIWQGLGYYSRARNLHKTAKILVAEYKGEFPKEYNLLLKLPGIGEYTAGAILSLAHNLPFPAVDGNVYRVLARYFGVDTPIDTVKGKREFYHLATEILDNKNPGQHNQAMIELGALICSPHKPLCSECPLIASCFARNNNVIFNYPAKKGKTVISKRYFYYLVIRKQNSYFIQQRSDRDIWALLFDFPMIESEKALKIPEDLFQFEKWQQLFKNKRIIIQKITPEIKHHLSHQIIIARFIEIEVEREFEMDEAREVNKDLLGDYPFPRLIGNYFAENLPELG